MIDCNTIAKIIERVNDHDQNKTAGEEKWKEEGGGGGRKRRSTNDRISSRTSASAAHASTYDSQGKRRRSSTYNVVDNEERIDDERWWSDTLKEGKNMDKNDFLVNLHYLPIILFVSLPAVFVLTWVLNCYLTKKKKKRKKKKKKDYNKDEIIFSIWNKEESIFN